MTDLDSFVHLHVHTDHSMLDGAARIGDLVGEAARLGMPAVGMTDHGTMSGAYDLHRRAAAAGITPVIGIEAYVAPAGRGHTEPVLWGSAGQKRADAYGEGGDVSGAGAYTHMTMLARDATGLRNLFRLSSRAWFEGYYRKPRMDAEIIAEHAEGIIATTGCPSGEVQTRLRLDQFDAALAAAETYRDVFGRENYFLELMDHGLALERSVRDGLLDIARRLGLRPLATNDSHYVTRDQAGAHAALLCVQSGSTLAAPNFAFDGDGYYLKSAAEMREFWDREVPGACDSSLLIAERVESYAEVFAHRDLMPTFPVPDGETDSSHLRAEVAVGLARIYPAGVPADRRERADYELDVILGRQLATYLLITADITREARERGIRVNARGSAVGSIVAYALGITGMDPIEHKLLFERFINPERPSMPDIDLDVDEHRRGELIAYVSQRYGADRVAQIATFGTIKAKAAVRDATRVLGHPFAVGDRITKALPPAVMGKDASLAAIDDPAHHRHGEAAEVRAMREADPVIGEILDTAVGLEGIIRQAGVHAAGVIVSAEPLVDVLPMWRRPKDGLIVTAFDYPSCEAMGLLKIDFLGLRNLGVIGAALADIRRLHGRALDLEALPLDDPAAFALLARGDTLGVFQLDGGPMRALLRAMEPSEFEHISAVLALYRPGPMGAGAHVDYAERKNGRQEIRPIHPELAEPLADILGDTYGLIVYQEQVMAIAQRVAGYSLGKADLLRRAMGKKKKEVLDAEFAPFSAGMHERGHSDEAIRTLWDILVPFSDYAFNRAHTAGYGRVSYWTAYLKANYPAEYMAAVLTSVGDDRDRLAIYLAECRRIGVKVLPPDVNESALAFTPVTGGIRFGLGAVAGIGEPVVQAIVATRGDGPFASFPDFLARVDRLACSKRAVGALILAGAFDAFGYHRRALWEAHEGAVAAANHDKKRAASGQFDIFDDVEDVAAPEGTGEDLDLSGPEWPRAELLARERTALGLYVSGHPLDGARAVLARHRTTTLVGLLDTGQPGREVRIAGMISQVQRKVGKASGKAYAVVTVEDEDGAAVEVLFFGRTYTAFSSRLATDAVVSVLGRPSDREGGGLIAVDMKTLDVTAAPVDVEPVVIRLPLAAVTAELVVALRAALESAPGAHPVHLLAVGERTSTLLDLPELHVMPSLALRSRLVALLGAGAVSWPAEEALPTAA